MTHVIPGIIKPLHILWNEMIGFVFICIAIIATPRVYREVAFWRARRIKNS